MERSGPAVSVVRGRDRGGREPQFVAKPVHAIGATFWAGQETGTCSELINVSGMIIVSWLEAHFDFPVKVEPEQLEATEADVETESSQQTVELV